MIKRNFKSIKPNLSGKRCKLIFFTSTVVFILSLVGQLYVTNHLAVKGREMVQLQEQKAQVSKEISELKLEQSKYTSLHYIEREAYALGFVKNDSYVSAIAPTTSTAALNAR